MKKITAIHRSARRKLFAVLAGIGMVLYACPIVSNLVSEQDTRQAVQSFQETVQAMRDSGSAQSGEKPLRELLAQAEAYNKKLFDEGQKNLTDPFSYEVSSLNLSKYGIEDDLFGFIEIPKLNVKLGIYLGAAVSNLSRGAAHLTQTSLPIGGRNTNSVLAAHRGTGHRDMFLRIDRLSVGDSVVIVNAWGRLTYRVASTEVIAPNQIDKALIQPGRDMVTLISCHPYGKNTQRYVVYCDRVPDG